MLERALTQARIPAGASDLHGSLCGFLCAGGAVEGNWMDSLALARADTLGAGHELLEALVGYCQHQLDDPQLSFHPLLPRDASPLAERAVALGAWCQGFLGGFGVASAGATMGEEAREILHDLAGIAASSFDFDESPEVDENAYAELLEYVRMGALYLRGELNPQLPASGRTH